MAPELAPGSACCRDGRLDLLDPSPLDIEIEDIAHGLARVARWNGQTKGDHAFSVAQHCVLVERHRHPHVNRHLDRPARLAALLHDAPEYVVGDMISPFKAALGLDYKAFEKRLLAAIHMRFGLPPATPEKLEAAIKKADRVAAYLEATQLAGFSIPEAEKFFGRPKGARRRGLAEIPPPETAAAHRSRGALSQGLPEAEQSMIIVCPLNKAEALVQQHGACACHQPARPRHAAPPLRRRDARPAPASHLS